MSELLGPAKQATLEIGAGGSGKARGRLALELVAMRGKDVVGVRHLQEGGTAWIGNATDTLARVSLRDIGGQPFLVGDARAGGSTLHVPPRARGRVHGSDGIPRLVIGPHRIELSEGERAVLVIGAVQIRAQVVPFEASTPRFKITAGVAAWLAVLGAVYIAAIMLSASAAQQQRPGPNHTPPAAEVGRAR